MNTTMDLAVAPLSTHGSHFTTTSGSEVNYKMQRLVRNSLCVL